MKLSLLLLAALTVVPATTGSLAGQAPTPDEARRLLATRPDLVAQVRERILSSGLSASEIRARLVAAGYPSELLDSYLPNVADPGTGGADDRVFAAARALGFADDELVTVLNAQAPAGGELPPGPDAGIFGMDVFRRGAGQFQPNLAGPVDPSYRLGPGDQLVLILTGDVELSHAIEVTREGFILIPQVGQLAVNGLTMSSLESFLYTRLAQVYSGISRGANATTRFQISVSRLRTNQVFVIGEVRQPSSYQISAAGTVLTALYAAGGPNENGSFRRVEVRRGGQTVATFDLYDYLLRGDNRQDIRLESGDVVFVPVRGTWASVTGEVVRPAIYELARGESLRDLIEVAGGFRPTASLQRVQIDRVLPPAQRQAGGRDRVVLDIAADQFADGTGPALPIESSDQVRVFAVTDRLRNFVTVRGNVWSEGRVAYTAGMTLGEAVRQAGGPKPDTYLDQVLVSRLNSDSTRTQLRAAFADSTGQVLADFTLREDDEVQVFSRTAFRPVRFVIVTGAVRSPGRIAYREGMTLRDALLQAGGVTEAAWLREAEIARLPEDRPPGMMAVTSRVPLDSTYLVDRGPDGSWLGPPGIDVPREGAPEVLLRPYDNVLILRQPEWELPRMVVVSGQVSYPGTYTLRTRGERLTDLLERAGGLTSAAYPAGISFFRRTLPLAAIPETGADQAAAGEPSRIGVDLPAVLDDPRHRDNLLLTSGDSVSIPEYNPIVRVTGAVHAPTGVTFEPGRRLPHYVHAAGGFVRLADRSRAYVVQPNGKVESVRKRWFIFPDGQPQPEPGAVIIVPLREEGERRSSGEVASFFTGLASILASTVAIIVVATR